MQIILSEIQPLAIKEIRYFNTARARAHLYIDFLVILKGKLEFKDADIWRNVISLHHELPHYLYIYHLSCVRASLSFSATIFLSRLQAIYLALFFKIRI
jgi:hypothetical protein